MAAGKGRKPVQRGPRPPRGRVLSTGKTKTSKGVKLDVSGARAKGPLGARNLSIMAEHHVKKGETLSQIAKLYYGYGDQKYVKLIQDLNKGLIEDKNAIQPGQVFAIPALPQNLRNK